MSRWFRLYDDTLNDPKVLKLSDKTYRIWIGILCVASKNNGTLPPFEDIAIMLRIKPEKLQPEIEKLIEAVLIDHDDDGMRPHNWQSRQYKSDVSTERVKRFRNGKRNVSETPPDTDTDTDTDTEKKKDNALRALDQFDSASRETPKQDDWPKDYRERFWTAYPRKKAKLAALKALDRIRKTGDVTFAKLIAAVEKIPVTDPAFIPHPTTWLNQGRWDDEQLPGENNGSRGPRPLQNDALSVGQASQRIADEFDKGTIEFPKRPSLLPDESQGHLRLLSKG